MSFGCAPADTKEFNRDEMNDECDPGYTIAPDGIPSERLPPDD